MILRASEQGALQEHLDTRAEIQRKPVAREPFVPEPLLDTDQAAAIMRIHPKTLQRMARQGLVPGFRVGDLWRFRASALDDWLRSGVCSKRHSCR